MATRRHSTMTGTDLHIPGYIAASDPGAVGAGILWVDTSTTPHSLKKRNAGNTGWDQVGLVTGTGATDASAGNHSHGPTTLTDWPEAIDDRVAALLVAGANVTLTYDDTANTLTIASSGGGGGGGGLTGTDDDVFITAYNGSGSTIPKGRVVIAGGTGFGSPERPVILPQAPTSQTPTLGLTTSSLAANATGLVQVAGLVTGIDTSGFTAGQEALSGAAGLLVGTGSLSFPADMYHHVGIVVAVDATAGSVRLTPYEVSVIPHGHTGAGDGYDFSYVPVDVVAAAGVPTPPSGQVYLYVAISDGKLYRKDSAAVSTLIG